MKIKPSLSLCMIVKNEADRISRAIESALPLISDLVVVDTGSSDGTIEIAQSLGARVISIPWENDFAEARNCSIKQARGEWILVLDADEAVDLVGREVIMDWVKHPTSSSAILVQTTYSNNHNLLSWKANHLPQAEAKGFSGYLESPLVRLFRKADRFRFVGKLHEELISSDPQEPKPEALPARIHHYGQVETTEERAFAKRTLYLQIAREKMRQQPNDAKAVYEYAVSCWETGNVADAYLAFDKVTTLFPTHVPSLCSLAILSQQAGENDKALGLLKKALQIRPLHIGALVALSDLLHATHRDEEALFFLDKAHQIAPEHPLVLQKRSEFSKEGSCNASPSA